MRVPTALVILTIGIPLLAAGPPPANPGTAANCSRTTSYLAGQNGSFPKGQAIRPQKLNELPPGTAFMAVYRHIGDCEVPLTMSDYRKPRAH